MTLDSDPMQLNDLLLNKKIDPGEVLVLRHRPHEPELNRVLAWLAAEKPVVFNAYQQTQSERVEKAMQRATYVASFVGHESRKALFIGLYEITGSKVLTRKQFWEVPANVQLKKFGMKGFTEKDPRPAVVWYDMTILDFYSQWQGKLVVDWPPPERSWWRWANQNAIPIAAILQDSALDRAMREWSHLTLTWDELAVLPTRWRDVISQWRGIYYIFDVSDRKGYVGSAYGRSNLLGRWLEYAKRGHGGNKLLRGRDPQNFRFSILERVSPDMDDESVIAIEATWKDRLHSRSPFGLNEN